MRTFIGLCQDATISDVERRLINRYVLAIRERKLHLAHIHYLTLQRIRHGVEIH